MPFRADERHFPIRKLLRILVQGVSANGRTPLQETGLHKANAVAKLLREHGAV